MGILAIILLIAITSLPSIISVRSDVSSPSKLTNWVMQAGAYNDLINKASDEAKQAVGNSDSSLNIDAHVPQAAKATFSPADLKGDINTFLTSNLAWLKGQTSSPMFKIDLTAQKQSFAKTLGADVEATVANLPTCTTAQLQKLQPSDPLTLGCKPTGFDPNTVSSEIAQQVETSSVFLSNPVITANNLGLVNQVKPYYQRYSGLPKVYRHFLNLPIEVTVLAVICIVGIIFCASRKRRGVKIISYAFIIGGVLLILDRLRVNHSSTQISDHIFDKGSHLNYLHQTAVNLIQIIGLDTAKKGFWCGIVYLLIGLIMLIAVGRRGKAKPKASKDANDKGPKPQKKADNRLSLNLRNLSHRSYLDGIGPSRPKPKVAQPTKPGQAPKRKPPNHRGRLIQ